MNLISDPHLGIKSPQRSICILVRGTLKYYHYVCDGFNDKGWGCGYRTLQTICSWIREQMEACQNSNTVPLVPSILEIQKALVQICDKTQRFVGSKDWIGSVEVAYCIDYFYHVQCKIIHARNVMDLKRQANDIIKHFKEFGSPIMMGGDQDCSSKCILGISENADGIWLLILDPHYADCSISRDALHSEDWVKWHLIDSLIQSSFYNLCCPLLKAIE